jgi:hypothetical protein
VGNHRLVALIDTPVNVTLMVIQDQHCPVFPTALHLPTDLLPPGLKPHHRLVASIRVCSGVHGILQHAEHRVVPSGRPDHLAQLFCSASDWHLDRLLIKPEIDLPNAAQLRKLSKDQIDSGPDPGVRIFLDAVVANDTTPGFLFPNLGGKRFEEVGTPAGVAYAPNGVALSGMGSDFRDINNDGRPDIWYTAVERETFPLLMNQGNGEFDDVTQSSGLQSTKDMSGWGNGIFDLDNDGWKDLLVVRANVLDNISELGPSRKYLEPNSLFRNLGNGKFADVGPSAGADFVEEAPHRGVAFGDLFNDGRIDAVVSVLGGPVEILRNVSETGNHWILLKLVGTKSNRMGLGAQIHITTADGASQWNEATTAVGYTGSSDSRVHFGLGKNRVIKDVEIRWPSGIKQVLHDVAADQILTVEEPQR